MDAMMAIAQEQCFPKRSPEVGGNNAIKGKTYLGDPPDSAAHPAKTARCVLS